MPPTPAAAGRTSAIRPSLRINCHARCRISAAPAHGRLCARRGLLQERAVRPRPAARLRHGPDAGHQPLFRALRLGLAYQARSPWLRSFLANSAITVASIAPAVILGLVWVVRERVQSFALYAAAIATATSGLATAYGEIARLAPYYPRFSLVTLLGSADQFAVVGAVVPVALSIAALRKARLPLTIPQPVRRAASALHGESDWLPIAAAKLWFNKGGIINRRGLSPRLKAQVRRQG